MLIALGCRVRSGAARTAAMIACILLVFGEPAMQAAISAGAQRGWWPPANWTMRISPVQALWDMTAGGDPMPWSGGQWGPVVISIFLAAVMGWTALAVASRVQGRGR